MDFDLNDEQRLLADMVRDFVRREYTFEKRRAIIDSEPGWSREIWAQLAELGLLGIGVPETHGGVDAGPVATMLVMHAIGAGLVVEPFLSSAVVGTALLRESEAAEHQRSLLPGMAAGELIVALAHDEADARHGPGDVHTRAEPVAQGYRISGAKPLVVGAEAADVLLVSARIAGGESCGSSLFRVARGAPGLTIDGYRALDGQRVADVELDGVVVSSDALIGAEHCADPLIERAQALGLAAVCAEAVGALLAVLDVTAEYLRTRRQFGQPIGRFQALQHRAADMLIHCEQARSMSYLATLRCQEHDPRERRKALSAAKVVVARACRFVAQQAVQLHGGMGVTDELSVSHYFKRLLAIELAFGGADHHLERFIANRSS